MNNLSEMLYDYGCKIYNYTHLDDVMDLIIRYNKILCIDNNELLYISCKDDAGVFVIVTNKYVIKIYKPLDYDRIVDIYKPITADNNFEHIEKIYYYYSVNNGNVIHDTYSKYNLDIDPNTDIHAVINELLIPITNINGMEIKSNIEWNKQNLRKLLLDVAEGLDVLHKSGTVHNDVTPDNIGLRPSDSNFVLFDFGQSVHNKNKNNKINDDIYKS